MDEDHPGKMVYSSLENNYKKQLTTKECKIPLINAEKGANGCRVKAENELSSSDNLVIYQVTR